MIHLCRSRLHVRTKKPYNCGKLRKMFMGGLPPVLHTIHREPCCFRRLKEPRKERFSIYRPSEFFDRKTGVCVDLARFAVETLKRIEPASNPKYVRIEFEPMRIEGNTHRFHWLVRFRRDGKTYFFADSKRPVHVAGPYRDTRLFIDAYEQYRGRKIVAFRELESYQKQRRTRAKQAGVREAVNHISPAA